MGNRGNVIFTSGERISPCVYLHWNGGPESVYRFLAELDARNVRADADYEAARFVEICGEFFSLQPHKGDDIALSGAFGLSLGIVNGPAEISVRGIAMVGTDDSDNGFYVVDRTQRDEVDHLPFVRRFVRDSHPGSYQSRIRELDRTEVGMECADAWAFHRYDGIAEFFADLRAAALEPEVTA